MEIDDGLPTIGWSRIWVLAGSFEVKFLREVMEKKVAITFKICDQSRFRGACFVGRNRSLDKNGYDLTREANAGRGQEGVTRQWDEKHQNANSYACSDMRWKARAGHAKRAEDHTNSLERWTMTDNTGTSFFIEHKSLFRTQMQCFAFQRNMVCSI